LSIENIKSIQNLIQHSVNAVASPSLAPSRIPQDLAGIQAFLEEKSQNWTEEGALILLAVHARLQGYQLRGRLQGGLIGWQVQSPPESKRNFRGAAVLLTGSEVIEICRQRLRAAEYDFIIGYLWNESLSVSPESRLLYIPKRDLLDTLNALAFANYRNRFSETISAMPGARKEYLKAVQQMLPQSWREIAQLHGRWLTLVEEGI
jgi:hypothetical protein